jgi:hypothetical protein
MADPDDALEMPENPINPDTPEAEQAFKDAIATPVSLAEVDAAFEELEASAKSDDRPDYSGATIHHVSRAECAAEVLGIPTEALEQALMTAWNEGQLSDVHYHTALRVFPAGEPDNWKHRSQGMRCSTCMWYVDKVKLEPSGPISHDMGRCRRHAPTMNGWPVMFKTDWCGDHKLDEEKLNVDD